MKRIRKLKKSCHLIFNTTRSIGDLQPVLLDNDLSEIYEAYQSHPSVKMIKGKMENLGTE